MALMVWNRKIGLPPCDAKKEFGEGRHTAAGPSIVPVHLQHCLARPVPRQSLQAGTRSPWDDPV